MKTKFIGRGLALLCLGLALQLGGCVSVGESYISAARNGKLPSHPGTRVIVLCGGVTDPINCELSFVYALERRGVAAVSGSKRHATLALGPLKDERRYITGGSIRPLFSVFPAPVGKFDAVLMVSVTWQSGGRRFSVQSLVAPYRIDGNGRPYLGYARREAWNALNLPKSDEATFAYTAAGFFVLKGYVKAEAGKRGRR